MKRLALLVPAALVLAACGTSSSSSAAPAGCDQALTHVNAVASLVSDYAAGKPVVIGGELLALKSQYDAAPTGEFKATLTNYTQDVATWFDHSGTVSGDSVTKTSSTSDADDTGAMLSARNSLSTYCGWKG